MISRQVKSLLLVGLLFAALVGSTSLSSAIEIGDKAPDFTLPSTTGEKISLSQFRAKKYVLLEFYVNDFGATWTKNLSARKVDYGKFKELDIQILGISANDPFSQKTFADSLKLPYPLLSDHPELKVIRNYPGVQTHKKLKRLVARRGFFVVDKEGIVQGKWLINNKDFFPSEKILKKVQELEGEI